MAISPLSKVDNRADAVLQVLHGWGRFPFPTTLQGRGSQTGAVVLQLSTGAVLHAWPAGATDLAFQTKKPCLERWALRNCLLTISSLHMKGARIL